VNLDILLLDGPLKFHAAPVFSIDRGELVFRINRGELDFSINSGELVLDIQSPDKAPDTTSRKCAAAFPSVAKFNAPLWCRIICHRIQVHCCMYATVIFEKHSPTTIHVVSQSCRCFTSTALPASALHSSGVQAIVSGPPRALASIMHLSGKVHECVGIQTVVDEIEDIASKLFRASCG
jgi:hypothetical protein